MELVDQAIAYLREGFANVNNDPKALLIALAAAILMPGWKQWIPFAVGAVVVHIAIEALAPLLAGTGGAVTLPPLTETPFWVRTGVFLIGYLFVIGVFFFLKNLLFKRKAAAH